MSDAKQRVGRSNRPRRTYFFILKENFMQDFWNEVDKQLSVTQQFIFSDEEAKHIGKIEQECYEKNLDKINEVLDGFKSDLEKRDFWVEKQVAEKGLRFRFSLRGHYGPGGFSSQFHVSGPLVVGVINPKGDAIQGFYNNDIDECQCLGADFDADEFKAFVQETIENYISFENLIITREQYDKFRDLYPNK